MSVIRGALALITAAAADSCSLTLSTVLCPCPCTLSEILFWTRVIRLGRFDDYPSSSFHIPDSNQVFAIIEDVNAQILEPLLSVRSHPWCLEHQPGLGHPEAPDRIQVILDAVSARVDGRWVVDRESPLPREEDIVGVLKWIHDEAYIDRVREAAEKGSGWLDSEDCRVSAGTFRSALAAAGLALQAAIDLLNERIVRSFVVARPPSHHAQHDRASGYCFFNTAAIAAEVVARGWGQGVVVADLGALHGDGLQQHFYDREDVGFVSVHRYPAFPGSGGADETGDGPGVGLTRNVPLAAGSDDEIVCGAFEHALFDICGAIKPAAIILATGLDAHRDDPLGGMQMTEMGLGRLTTIAVRAAEYWTGGRLLSILEGGFELEALAKSARIHVEELAKTESEIPEQE